MYDALLQLALFTAKSLIIVMLILLVLIAFFALLAKAKQRPKGKLTVTCLNDKYDEATETILLESLPKQLLKAFLKHKKSKIKVRAKQSEQPKVIYVLNFNGDIRASAVSALREEITAILNAETPPNEIIVRLESTGGIVPAYGLAASQLMRIRNRQIPLTITIDKVAASGGYMMACVADKILAAPFAIVGSIGVVVQLPNFHRVLKEKNVDFEQLTAGEYKRTLTVFGQNTDEGREKLQEELEEIHTLFKQLILENRQQIDISKVATGEHWPGRQALELKLVDEIKTSDEYLLERCKEARLFEICYETRKPLLARLSSTASKILGLAAIV